MTAPIVSSPEYPEDAEPDLGPPLVAPEADTSGVPIP